jgi:hypothetical protein
MLFLLLVLIIAMGFSELHVTYVKFKELVCQRIRGNERQTLKNLYLTSAEPEKVAC